jgi:hypothetical protein
VAFINPVMVEPDMALSRLKITSFLLGFDFFILVLR